jgi:acetoin utilization protein AcuC
LAIPRVESVVDLCNALGWLTDDEYRSSPRASAEQLAWFHDAGYVAALREASASRRVDLAARQRYAIGTMENPLFRGVYERAATSVGGSILAAELALDGRVVFHPAGGTHHGRPARASGFCYFNDPVFAILRLLHGGLERVLYVDLDAHHGDGVQDAFANDSRVFTISIHEAGRWPHTGEVTDTGGGRACNLPVPAQFSDSELHILIDGVVLPLAARVAPHAMVITCGGDALAGDPLTTMALTNVALWQPVRAQVAALRDRVLAQVDERHWHARAAPLPPMSRGEIGTSTQHGSAAIGGRSAPWTGWKDWHRSRSWRTRRSMRASSPSASTRKLRPWGARFASRRRHSRRTRVASSMVAARMPFPPSR